MDLTILRLPTLVFVHLLMIVLWLGADVDIYVLGQHFRKRNPYTLDNAWSSRGD